MRLGSVLVFFGDLLEIFGNLRRSSDKFWLSSKELRNLWVSFTKLSKSLDKLCLFSEQFRHLRVSFGNLRVGFSNV